MKTDISKLSFDEMKHYLGVFLQMGRVQLDSDWNEQSELWLRLLQRHAGDTVDTGSPNHGFRVDDRILLDAMDSRDGWEAVADLGDPDPYFYVDYFDHRTSEGALWVEGAVSLTRRLGEPLDLSGLEEVVFAAKGSYADPCVFFLTDADSSSYDLNTTKDPDPVEGWDIFRADLTGLPSTFRLDAVVAYGFHLDKGHYYLFDFLKIDRPIRQLLVPAESAAAFTVTPLHSGDAPRLTLQDDDRIWKSTVLETSKAGSVRYKLPAPRDLSHVRRLLLAFRSSDATASLSFDLKDAADNDVATCGPLGVDAADAWKVEVWDVPGGFGSVPVQAVEWHGLTAASYLLAPVLVEMSLEGNLVIQGGDGTSEGAGRFYGDGLGAVKEAHETYYSQADLPEADPDAMAPPSVGTCRIDLAYLDLWERPITYIEDPEVRETALEGPDTCTRTQLVAQVRILPGAEAAADPEPPWDDFAALPRCGGGTLSTKDKPDAVLDPCADPCEPEVAGTFIGEENRLYRVEIHTCGGIGPEGAAGTATFKWSAENGAVACPLLTRAESGALSIEVEKPELFQEGDLIEISDDLVDLVTGPYEDRVTHRCHLRGELRKVTGINLDGKRISWDGPDPDYNTPLVRGYTLAYHAKIRRWDGERSMTPEDEDGNIVLDDGVVVEFGGSDFVPGDYWVFTTRVADRSVERLIEEPPRGICHRYFKLATLTRCNVGGVTSLVVDDCRPAFNPLTALEATDVAFDSGRCSLCDASWEEVGNVQEAIEKLCGQSCRGGLCSVTVGDGEISFGEFINIQAAIDSLEGHGGEVCLLRGNHVVEETVDVPSNVVLRGTGPATRIAFAPAGEGGALFNLLADAKRVRLEDFFAVTARGSSLVSLNGGEDVAIRGCTLANLRMPPLAEIFAGNVQAPVAVDARVGEPRDLAIEGCNLLAAVAVHGTSLARARIHKTVIRSPYACLFSHKIEDLHVVGCHLAGIDEKQLGVFAALGEIGGDDLSGVQYFVQAVLDEREAFGLAGYVAVRATQVTFADNQVMALVGLLPLQSAFHDVHRCYILGYLDVVFPSTMFSTLKDCMLYGYANVSQGGLAIDLDLEGNRMLGLYGVSIVSFSVLRQSLLQLLVALSENDQTGFFSGLNAASLESWLSGPTETTDSNLAFGLALLVTARDNLFVSYQIGIGKGPLAFTGDVTITGNRFYVCKESGISLAGEKWNHSAFGLEALALGHDIHHNHFQVQGGAVSTQVLLTVIEENRIHAAGEAALRLEADLCQAVGNTLVLQPDKGGGDGIRVGSSVAAVGIRDNLITGGNGSGIVLEGLTTGLRVEGNQIGWMGLNGITAASGTVVADDAVFRGNRIRYCVADTASFWELGGIVLADGARITIADNQVWMNGRGQQAPVHGIYAEDVEHVVVSGNQIWDNGGPEDQAGNLEGGGLTLMRAGQDVQVLGNSLLRNRGYGLRIAESSFNFLYFVVGDLVNTAVAFAAEGPVPPRAAPRAGSASTVDYTTVSYAEYNTGLQATDSLWGSYHYWPATLQQAVTIAGNTITGVARPYLVYVVDVERLLVNDNRLLSTGPDDFVAARISAGNLIFTGNHVEAPVGRTGWSVWISALSLSPRIIQSQNILSGGSGQLLPTSAFVVNSNNLFL